MKRGERKDGGEIGELEIEMDREKVEVEKKGN